MVPFSHSRGGGAVVSATTTLDPSFNPAPDVSYSNGNLTGTNNDDRDNVVRTTTTRSSGKRYFEYKPTNVGDSGSGILSSAVNKNDYVLAVSGAYCRQAAGNGEVGIVAIDFDNKLIWFGKNGTFTGSPAAGTGGTQIAAGSYYAGGGMDASNQSILFNFGASAFSYAPPSGFSAWG